MLYRIFEIVAPILLVVLAGYFYGRRKNLNMDSANAANLDVFVPALVLSVFASRPINLADYTGLMFMALAITLIPGLLALMSYRLLGVAAKTFALPMMFKNSGNLGIPLLLLTFGEQYLPAILLMFIVTNVLHFSVGIWMLSPQDRSLAFLKQPNIIATIAGIGLSMLHVSLPNWLVIGLDMLGDVAVPLMLFALGVRLVGLDFHGWRVGLVATMAAPLFGLLAVALCLPFVDLSDTHQQMVWIFAALPPAVLNYLLAERYKLEPDKMAAMVMFANAGSIFIIPAVLYFIL